MKNIKFFILFLLLNIFGLSIWGLIPSSQNLVGDLINFIIFLFITTFPIYYLLKKNREKNYYTFSEILIRDHINTKKNSINLPFFFIIFLITLVSFLSFDKSLFFLDVYHDGLKLTPSMNYLISHKFFNSSYVESGFFPNFKTLIYYYFQKNLTIGSLYFISYLIIFLNKILLLFLWYLIVTKFNFTNKIKIVTFLLGSFFLLQLAVYDDFPHFLERHSLQLLFFVLIFLHFFSDNKFTNFVVSLLISFISVLLILWWIDIFVFTNLLFLIYLFLLFKLKEFFKIKIFLVNFFLIFILSIIFLPTLEFKDFFSNLYSIFFEFNEFTFIKYPTPLDLNDGRALKTLFFFSYFFFLFIYFFLKKSFNVSNNLRLFILLIIIVSVINYIYALGRSDSYHIKGSSGFLVFGLIFFHIYIIFNVRKIQIFFNRKLIFLFFNSLILLSCLFSELNFKKINNINNFSKNVKFFVSADDNYFLTEKNQDYVKLKSYYNSLISNNECVQIFTDETILPYLLKKQTCSKYFIYHILNNNRLQSKLINDLYQKKPKYILVQSDIYKLSNFSNRLILVQDFISSNYIFHEKFLHWTFFKLKD